MKGGDRSQNNEYRNSNKYDLEERCFSFAKDIRGFYFKLPRELRFHPDMNQLVRSSGSIGANYIEANESLGEKDFLMRIKISRKEAKESAYWIKLVMSTFPLEKSNQKILKVYESEAVQLMKIFGSIYHKSK